VSDRSRGNPGLFQTAVRSYDLRWEWFFSPLELASAGFFYKELKGPIEPVTVFNSSGAIDTWVNGSDATLFGVEIEGRKNFGFVHERLRPLRLLANFTWADSDVTVPTQQVLGLTTVSNPNSRRLVGQAPFIINTGLEYASDVVTAALLYYTADDSISSVGVNGFPDIVLQRRDQLDAVLIVPLKRWLNAPINAKLSAENLLNDPYVFSQPPAEERYADGVKFTLSFTLVSQ
jgi:hypothetical protein